MESQKKILKLTIDSKIAGNKLIDVLKDNFELSNKMIKKFDKENKIFVNSKNISLKSKLKENETVSVEIDCGINNITPENLVLNVIYEDDDLLIVNKPKNMVVHPTKNVLSKTLANAVSNHQKINNQNYKIRFVNRLDMDTTGLLIVAKNSYSHQQLAKQMDEGILEKIYIAVVNGHLDLKEGIIEDSIDLNDDGIRRELSSSGKISKTKYKVIEELKNASVLEINLLTGRTHQIRVHLSSIGNYIIGDTLYGEISNLIDRQALHSHILRFIHPITKERMEFTSKLPDDIKNLIKNLKE
ncbi:RluA family pseudouridine synthase [Methanococcus maripaludis]|jgi:23S rRNA pseudouridine1911/1915/1917 synthase|uniref:RluA family pseudouridine synthase n=4 Tax=Methanococcus maripaludis TaxID=39152 RepID=A0A8T3VZ83_METMI|nr:RluA family pseudouridine synthase [Methanococcus maripaludis]AEK20041.1 RluA family pseudouridine synthase [Methanococcus maripaludis X1]MBG0768604.1 RluA family pseudouridine synthase [Methanococcus maripaludis]BAP61286.1 putative pseudouridine synthase [Methanococcus maripaludis KA1]BAP63190.1 putative pseudouridine synthase [Methanococcus maripaludis OS7]